VLDNWRIRHWECRQAERLAIKRNLDGAARAHFKGGDVPDCPAGCPGSKDEQEHWLLICKGLEGVRNEGWKLVEEEVGEWVRELSVVEQHLLMAGRIPERVEKLMGLKGKVKPGESVVHALGRLQAGMVKFGITVVAARRARKDMGLGGEGREMEGVEQVLCLCCGEPAGGRMCGDCQGDLDTAMREGRCMNCGVEEAGEGLCQRCEDEEEGGGSLEASEEEFGFEAGMGICALCGNETEQGRCKQCDSVLGEGLQEGMVEQPKPRERLSRIIDRIAGITCRETGEVVRVYIEMGRDEDATIDCLGIPREGAPSPDRATQWARGEEEARRLHAEFVGLLQEEVLKVERLRSIVGLAAGFGKGGKRRLPGEYARVMRRTQRGVREQICGGLVEGWDEDI
jgi:hypothetical protein